MILRHADISTTQAYYIVPNKTGAKVGMGKLSKVLASRYGVRKFGQLGQISPSNAAMIS
jgi:hypothetical protein